MGFNKSTFSITAINIVNTTVTVLSSIIVARFFGTTREIEVYFASNVIIFVLLRLSQNGEIGEILLPIYNKYKYGDNHEIAQRIVSTVFNWYAIGLFIITGFVYMYAPWLVKIIIPGFTSTDQLLGTQFIRSLSPLLVFMFINGQINSLLNAEKQFGKPESINMLAQLIRIFTIIIGIKYFGIWIMVIAQWIATATKFISLVCLYYMIGNRHYLHLWVPGYSIIPLLKKIWSTLYYVGSHQLWIIVLNSGLSTLPEGTLAVFNYASNLSKHIQGVFLKPISTVFFSHFAEGFSKGNNDLKRLINKALANFELILFPAIVIVFIAGRSGLMFLWYGDKFSQNEVILALFIIKVLLVLFSIISLNTIARKIIITLGYVKLVFSLMSACMLAQSIIGWFIIRSAGINGVLFLISFSTLLQFMMFFGVLGYYHKALLFFYSISDLFKWIVSACSTFIIITIGINIIEISFANNRLNYLLQAATMALFSIIIILGLAALLDIAVVKSLAKHMYKKVKQVFG